MKAEDYYPAGAYNDPRAPYNQIDPEPVKVAVTISQTLSRSTTISVRDYIANEWVDAEPDGEGGLYRTGGVEYDFSDSDFQGAYENQEYTIPELLDYLKDYLQQDLEHCEDSQRQQVLQHILEACDGWEVDETEVIES